jgi:hypothetical protein
MYAISDFRVGDRVELHPATDLWMRGARFGNIEGVGRSFITVRLDTTRRARLPPSDIWNIISLAHERQTLVAADVW